MLIQSKFIVAAVIASIIIPSSASALLPTIMVEGNFVMLMITMMSLIPHSLAWTTKSMAPPLLPLSSSSSITTTTTNNKRMRNVHSSSASSSSALFLARRPKKDDNNNNDESSPADESSSNNKRFKSGLTPSSKSTTTATTLPPTMDPAKQMALDGVLNTIERLYGRGSIVKLGDADHMTVECIGSGALTLDVALGGGYPKGRVIEIYGPESSGKTTLALHAIATTQQLGGVAAFIDAEHALDPNYAQALGVNVNTLLVSQPDSGEMALEVVDQLVRSSAVDVIVVDSVAALVPRAELEGDMSDQQIGLQARLMSKALRKITGSLPLSQCTVIFLNQLRSKIGVMYGSPEVTAGGNALKYYASIRLDTRRKEILSDNTGIRVKVKVVKNKVAPPFKAVTLDILFGSGLDRYGCTLDAALELGIIDRKGSWYAYNGQNIAQGRASVIELMKQQDDNDLNQQLETQVRAALLSSSTTSVEGSDDAVVANLDNDDENVDNSMMERGDNDDMNADPTTSSNSLSNVMEESFTEV